MKVKIVKCGAKRGKVMKKRKIMVIDDDAGFNDMVKEVLEETGKYEVKTENGGHLAFSAIKMFKPHLILLDVVIPGIDGPHIAEKVINDSELKNTPIVFISALFSPDMDEGMERSSIILAKPLTIKELIECIEKN